MYRIDRFCRAVRRSRFVFASLAARASRLSVEALARLPLACRLRQSHRASALARHGTDKPYPVRMRMRVSATPPAYMRSWPGVTQPKDKVASSLAVKEALAGLSRPLLSVESVELLTEGLRRFGRGEHEDGCRLIQLVARSPAASNTLHAHARAREGG